jgi:hypothetical protein
MRLWNGCLAAYLVFCSGAVGVRENVPMPREAPVSEAETSPVVVVALDGAMWQDVTGERGRELMPNLRAVVDREGVELDEVYASGGSQRRPNYVSLPGYTELFEGKRWTGCTDNFCPGATFPTIVDEIRAQHQAPTDVAVISSWERIAFASTVCSRNVVVSSGTVRAQGSEWALAASDEMRQEYQAGRSADAYPGHGDYRPDRYTAPLALSYFRTYRPAFMFVGLGDTDDYAHRGDRRGYLNALQQADRFISGLVLEIARMGDRGKRTTVIVTADHGRSNGFVGHGGEFPESSRTWLFAWGPRIAHARLSSGPVRHLADVAPTVREIVGLPQNPLSDGNIIVELLTAAVKS